MAKKIIKKKKILKDVAKAAISVSSSFNNTIISISDETGAVIGWSSAGACGFKGAKRATPYAAQITMQKALENVTPFNIKEAKVKVSGVGAGRESAVRAIGGSGIKVTSIKDTTPMPHNGCRPKKVRRV
ncbi:MAG: 30S ribosomal protein S11 [Candidatus Berkelbacteria bacterium]